MTGSLWRFSLSVAAVWLCACQSSSTARTGDAPNQDRVSTSGPRVSAIGLERQPCFGTCPVYTVDIDSAGQVRFDGRAHVKFVGAATADIGTSAFRAMADRIVRSGFPSFSAGYTAGTPGCGEYITDQPVVTLTAVIDGAPKKVIHDYGCYGAPRVLRQLHRMIDSVASTSRWIQGS